MRHHITQDVQCVVRTPFRWNKGQYQQRMRKEVETPRPYINDVHPVPKQERNNHEYVREDGSYHDIKHLRILLRVHITHQDMFRPQHNDVSK